jgi:hypothetical protein
LSITQSLGEKDVLQVALKSDFKVDCPLNNATSSTQKNGIFLCRIMARKEVVNNFQNDFDLAPIREKNIPLYL